MTRSNPESVTNAASEAVERLQRAAGSAVKEGQQKAGALLDQGGELIDSASDQASDQIGALAGRVVEFTKERPITALLLAAAAGALLVGVIKASSLRR